MDGILLFLVATGLTLIFGVLRLLNFAHGGLFMLGAYFGYTLAQGRSLTAPGFLAVVVLAALSTGAVGLLAERLVFRRLYGAPETQALLGTYALLLILEGAAQLTWGIDPVSEATPPSLAGAVTWGAVTIPQYALLLAAVAAVCLGMLEAILRGSRLGRYIRAVAEDATMASLLGIDGTRVAAATVALGAVLAGLGGALAAPTLSLLPDVAGSFIIQAFAVVIIGGLGSVYGALVASLLAGVANSLVVAYAPAFSGYTLYALMVLVLLLRPQGLFGPRREEG
jgi:branched-chain amino acid transport system permease protein